MWQTTGIKRKGICVCSFVFLVHRRGISCKTYLSQIYTLYMSWEFEVWYFEFKFNFNGKTSPKNVNDDDNFLDWIFCHTVLIGWAFLIGVSCWVNDYDKPFTFTCPQHQSINRVVSHHDNGPEDRVFDFECSKYTTASESCHWSGETTHHVTVASGKKTTLPRQEFLTASQRPLTEWSWLDLLARLHLRCTMLPS